MSKTRFKINNGLKVKNNQSNTVFYSNVVFHDDVNIKNDGGLFVNLITTNNKISTGVIAISPVSGNTFYVPITTGLYLGNSSLHYGSGFFNNLSANNVFGGSLLGDVGHRWSNTCVRNVDVKYNIQTSSLTVNSVISTNTSIGSVGINNIGQDKGVVVEGDIKSSDINISTPPPEFNTPLTNIIANAGKINLFCLYDTFLDSLISTTAGSNYVGMKYQRMAVPDDVWKVNDKTQWYSNGHVIIDFNVFKVPYHYDNVGKSYPIGNQDWYLTDTNDNILYQDTGKVANSTTITTTFSGSNTSYYLPNYAVDIGNTSFKTYFLQYANTIVNNPTLSNGYKGIFVKNIDQDLNFANVSISGTNIIKTRSSATSFIPKNKRTGGQYTLSQWRSDVASLLEDLQTKFINKEITHDIKWVDCTAIGSNTSGNTSVTVDTHIARQLRAADYIHLESGFNDKNIQSENNDSKYGILRLFEYIDNVHNSVNNYKNSNTAVIIGVGQPNSSVYQQYTNNDAELQNGVNGFRIINNGFDYLSVTGTATVDFITPQTYRSDIFDLDVGDGIGSFTKDSFNSNAWIRRFTKGTTLFFGVNSSVLTYQDVPVVDTFNNPVVDINNNPIYTNELVETVYPSSVGKTTQYDDPIIGTGIKLPYVSSNTGVIYFSNNSVANSSIKSVGISKVIGSTLPTTYIDSLQIKIPSYCAGKIDAYVHRFGVINHYAMNFCALNKTSPLQNINIATTEYMSTSDKLGYFDCVANTSTQSIDIKFVPNNSGTHDFYLTTTRLDGVV